MQARNRLNYTRSDARVLHDTLVRLRRLARNARLPAPYLKDTGVVGRSRVYFLYIPHGRGGLHLVAKFDAQDRARREWRSLCELRRRNVSPQFLLPISGNKLSDGVILYNAAQAVTPQGVCWNLLHLLRTQMQSAPTNCVKALDLAIDALALFHRGEPGTVLPEDNGKVLRWADFVSFPRLRLKRMFRTARKAWPSVDWASDTTFSLRGIGARTHRIPNPFAALNQRLHSPTGPIRLSRIHGDLNLTNLLFALSATHTPTQALIIDLANSEEARPTAIDFARLESEFWNEGFVGSLSSNDELAMNESLGLFLQVRDLLDGRRRTAKGLPKGKTEGVLTFVNCLRRRASTVLSPSVTDYMLKDYLYALYFHAMNSLAFPSVYGNGQLKARIALASAAIAQQTLQDIEAGRYSQGATRRLLAPFRELHRSNLAKVQGQQRRSAQRKSSDNRKTLPSTRGDTIIMGRGARLINRSPDAILRD